MLSMVIQAGGQSRRMGQDKALLPFLGQTLIERVIARVAPLAGELLVTTNRAEDYAFLNLPLIPDLLPGRGALGGLYTALQAARFPLVGVVACDMPFASAALLGAERDELLAHAYDAAIPRTELGPEPFHAVYRRATCLPLVEAALQAGQWRVNAWLERADLRWFSAEEVARYDPEGLAFWNTNTPEELEKALTIAKSE